MAATENKLELLRQIRMEHDTNIREIQNRETILYGKPYSYGKTYATAEKPGTMGRQGRAYPVGMGFFLRCVLTLLLCGGIYYLVQQPDIAGESATVLLNKEQTEQVKTVMENWLTKNDLSFDAK